MSKRTDADRRNSAHEAAVRRSKEKREFDGAVARDFAAGLSVRESQRERCCSKKRIEASRGWQGIHGRPADTELLVEIQLECSKQQRRFDADVALHFYDYRTAGESAALLGCERWKVEASRAWQGIASGRNTDRKGLRTGRLGSRAAVEGMRRAFRSWGWAAPAPQ